MNEKITVLQVNRAVFLVFFVVVVCFFYQTQCSHCLISNLEIMLPKKVQMGADVLRCGTYSSRAALFQANAVVQMEKTLFTSKLRSIGFGSEYRSLQHFL